MKMKYTRDTIQACELVEAMYKGQINPCMVHATMHGNILYIYYFVRRNTDQREANTN